jgi:hypothetical protein
MTGNDGEVWLYGSASRGDTDSASDYDMLVLGAVPRRDIRALCAEVSRPVLSAYSYDEVAAMAMYGSLFLHHVKMEGRLLLARPGPSRLEPMLAHLPPYARSSRDIVSFRKCLEDVEESVGGECSLPFEASTLTAVIRHAGILGSYLAGQPCFSRLEPVSRMLGEMGEGYLIGDFERLYLLALRAQRGTADGSAISLNDVGVWLDIGYRVIDHVEVLDARHRAVCQAD